MVQAKSALDRVIVALDSMTDQEAIDFAANEAREFSFFKIGLELYLAYGPELILKLSRQSGARIFLDLKLHDIPNTVDKAISSLKGLPIEFLTIHLSGGGAMIERALASARQHLPGCQLLGVSVLTSLEASDLNEIWGLASERALEKETFTRLFTLAKTHGLSGLVCSPHEVPTAREVFGSQELTVVTPGIRFEDEIQSGELGDQKRVLAPSEALKLGSSYLVMGRSLTKTKTIESRILQLQNIKI